MIKRQMKDRQMSRHMEVGVPKGGQREVWLRSK